VQGWVLVERGQEEEGVVQIRQGLGDYQATGTELILPDSLALLAAVYLKRGQIEEEGLKAVIEALARIEKSGGRMWEAELYRLKGELTLQQLKIKNAKLKITEMQDPTAGFQEAEACFQKAIAVARKQKAKSLELRAVMSFVHLRQQQAQNHATRNTKHAPDSTKLTRC
jgi:predicted ATPase